MNKKEVISQIRSEYVNKDIINLINNDATEEDLQIMEEGVFLIENPDYNYKPASFRMFIKSNKYLGLGSDIYENIIELGTKIVQEDKREIVVLAGIGGGKSTLSQLLACYYCHVLLCMKDPHKKYSLTKDKPIVIINMGLNADQARNVIFSGIREFILNSFFFKNFKHEIRQTTIRFQKGIHLISGNSKETAPIGMNVFVGILDEAAFYIDNDKKSIAEEIFNTMSRRLTSRFKGEGKLIAVSSPRYQDDFIHKAYKESIVHDSVIFGFKAPTWILKDRGVMQEDAFVFNRHTMCLSPNIKLSAKNKRELKFNDKDKDEQYIIIPMEFEPDFIRNPERAMRDFGAEPSETLESFIKIKEYIELALGKCENRVSDTGVWDIQNPDSDILYCHIDLALNRNGKGDAAGIAFARCIGFDNKKQGRPIIEVPFIERITAGDGSEIQFSDIRRRVIALRDIGWTIGSVTLDGFQCLRKGTKIPLASGELKNIEDIKKGDLVYSKLENKKDTGYAKVVSAWRSGIKEIYRVYLSNEKFVDCSDNHPFMLKSGAYKHARDLQENDELMTLDEHNKCTVKKVENLKINKEVWDIEVENTHNFAIEQGVFVHNSFDTMQILLSYGIMCKYQSVDANIEPYNSLKDALYQECLYLPNMPILKKELRELELVKGKYVDHPPSGCFTKETRVVLLDGTSPSFEELCKRYPNGEEFEVFSISTDGVRVGIARNPRLTIKNAEIYELELDNGYKVRCTGDHLFMTKNFDYVKAKEIGPDLSLMPFYRFIQENKNKHRSKRLNFGFTTTLDSLVYKCPLRHCIKAVKNIYEEGDKKARYKFIRVNKTDNFMDNRACNLRKIPLGKYLAIKKVELLENRIDKGIIIKRQKEYGHSSKIDTKAIRQRKKEDKISRLRTKDFDRIRSSSNKDINKLVLREGINFDDDFVDTELFNRLLAKQHKFNNHKVVSIKKLKHKEDVYDLTVDKYHNFALDVGVFVHNSKDVSDAVAGAVYGAVQNVGTRGHIKFNKIEF